MGKKFKNFWSDGLSINEYRVSSLLLAFWLALIALIYLCIKTLDTSPLVNVILTLIAAITGLNIFKKDQNIQRPVEPTEVIQEDSQDMNG